MDLGYTIVKMEHNLKVNFKMDKNMELVHIHFLTVNQEWVNGIKVNEYNGLIKIGEIIYILFIERI